VKIETIEGQVEAAIDCPAEAIDVRVTQLIQSGLDD